MTSPAVVFNSINFKIVTPDGTMFVNVMESDEGRPIAVQINIGKAGAAISAWAQAVAVLVTKQLEAGVGINDIIVQLSELRAERRTLTDTSMIPIRSGPDGLCAALMMYRKEKYSEHMEILGGEERRPPTINGS